MEKRTLGRTGFAVSILSFGAAPLGGVYGEISDAAGIAAVRHAIDRGINFVDTSPYYGITRSESVLGEALQGGYREKVILCTKAGRDTKTDFNFSRQHITQSLDASLRRLRTDYVDILIAHDIEFADDFERVFTETADTLHELKRTGKCRAVGMSGYPLGILVKAVERCNLDVVLSYCHATLINQQLFERLLPVAQQHGTGLINASPLSMGLLTMAGPPEWHPAPQAIKDACRQAAAICQRHNVDLAKLALSAVLHDSRLTTTLSGMSSVEEVDKNLAALESPPDPAILAEVQQVLAPVSTLTWPSGNWRD